MPRSLDRVHKSICGRFLLDAASVGMASETCEANFLDGFGIAGPARTWFRTRETYLIERFNVSTFQYDPLCSVKLPHVMPWREGVLAPGLSSQLPQSLPVPSCVRFP